jgi:hypothetical protein
VKAFEISYPLSVPSYIACNLFLVDGSNLVWMSFVTSSSVYVRMSRICMLCDAELFLSGRVAPKIAVFRFPPLMFLA